MKYINCLFCHDKCIKLNGESRCTYCVNHKNCFSDYYIYDNKIKAICRKIFYKKNIVWLDYDFDILKKKNMVNINIDSVYFNDPYCSIVSAYQLCSDDCNLQMDINLPIESVSTEKEIQIIENYFKLINLK